MAVMDRREIEFDAAALLHVVASSLRSAQSFGLPGLQPTSIRFYPGEGHIDVIYGSGQTQQAVRLAAEPLGALLVSYCIRARIPMPRKADKGIRIGAGVAVLAFTTRYAELPVAEIADTAARTTASVKSWGWIQPEKPPAG